MSLAAMNAPPLVAAAGAGCAVILPLFQRVIEEGALSWNAVKVLNAGAYAVNFISVSIPGRIDGGPPAEDEKRNKDMDEIGSGRQGKHLVAPAGWAFTIWAPIFMGELVSAATQLTMKDTAAIQPVLYKMSAPYIIANGGFQSLWTAAFRRKYKGVFKFVAPFLLGGTAYSLSLAHKTMASSQLSTGNYLLYGLPLTLHFGWVTAATLVNLNAAISTCGNIVSSKSMAVIGHVSVILASALGTTVAITRGAPVYAGVITWALLAVADGMTRRIQSTEKEDPERMGVYGSKVQRRLCRLGALVSGSACVYTAVKVLSKPKRN